MARTGRRCEARGFLEFHHKTPYAEGGAATVENIELRCRSHNGYEAELFCGMDRGLGRPDTVRETGASYRAELVPGRVGVAMGSL